MAELDTGMFKVHSTRSASTFKADLPGVSLADVIKQSHCYKMPQLSKRFIKKMFNYSSNFKVVFLSRRVEERRLER